VTVVDALLEQAARSKASDIHIEPFDTFLRIRYRIDGALVEQPSLPIQMHPAIIARLKVMGKMNIAEKRVPQDGRITFMLDKVEYDVRASMLPTVYGEKCVMRLALRANLQRDKKDLGLTPYDLKIFDKIFSNPNGIILVTGPTGSGKSTTLYTALSELSTEEVNIVTVEDPVEANVDGVNQVHTNAVAGLTFASALRSILRQDPDIIMIGEIRDQETAEIAVQAAITGHLVVSTLHTNSSAATVTRLINMGIEPYLVADSVVGILAQRLVRRLCPRCKQEKIATEEELKDLGVKKSGVKLKIYEKCGCTYCNNTGFQGRIAVYEIMDVGPELKELIMNNATSAEIKRVAVENGMHTLHRSAAELVINGTTTMSEMRKVSSES
jgi:type IV pilus assembly protein PilB